RSSKTSSLSHPINRYYNEYDAVDDYSDSNADSDSDEDYTTHHNRHLKKRKLDAFGPGYNFAPRVGGRDPQHDWTEHATFGLLEIWGRKFLQLGRVSLRCEHWSDVAERVSEATGINFSVSACRNRLNFLKIKYKKEKMRFGGFGGGNSKWVYFKKMDELMRISPRQEQQCGLACGVDSGEFVFMNPRVYLEHSNALDEMRDSPGNSESEEEEEAMAEQEGGCGGSGGGKGRNVDEENDDYELYKMSDSIKRVEEIYEKIETTKRQHMMELEKMRMEFQQDLELQKKEMIERTRAEIAKILEADDDEDTGCSAESASE
ncbi:hypothetical protein Dimus_003203, partial [Dionaea muscipula]